MSEMTKTARLPVMALFLGVSACGGGGGSPSAPTTPTTPAVTAPAITTQPESRVVPVGQVATFSVVASGSGLTYAWQRDGVAIADATSASYTTPPTTTLDDGARFTVVVTNGGGTVASRAAQLRIEGFAPTAGAMAARQNHAAVRLADGRVLLCGGWAGAVLASAELYDPATDTFAPTGGLVAARQHHTATLLASGKVLVTGGEGGTGGGLPLRTAELYDPTTGRFTPAGPMRVARTQHVATLLADGKVLVTGGLAAHTASGQVASAEVYDPVADAFTDTANGLSAARYWHAAALLADGKVLVVGGYGTSGGALDGADVYDPATRRFTPTTAPLTAARYAHTATLLPGGAVLVAGGYGAGYLASAELYDPAAGTFALTGPLSGSRYLHSATALPGGKVLVAGGLAARALATAELYDPVTAVFAPTGALSTGRYLDTATLLESGEVLVAGGWSTGDLGLGSAELFSGAP